jgi:hypothetical protein
MNIKELINVISKINFITTKHLIYQNFIISIWPRSHLLIKCPDFVILIHIGSSLLFDCQDLNKSMNHRYRFGVNKKDFSPIEAFCQEGTEEISNWLTILDNILKKEEINFAIEEFVLANI